MVFVADRQVFVNVPSISLLEWHPFSLTSAPRGPCDEIAVRPLGDFTKALHAMAVQHIDRKRPLCVRVDGPYGDVGLDMRRCPIGVYVAGGVGITPIIGILRHIFDDDALFGGLEQSRKEKSMVVESGPSVSQVYVIWSVQAEVSDFAFPRCPQK